MTEVLISRFSLIRLVFTSDGVAVEVVIRSVELYDLVKQRSDSAYDSLVYDQVKTRLSESEAEAEELNQTQSVETCIVIGLSFPFCFRLRQYGFYYIVSDGVISGVGKNGNVDSSDADSIAVMTLLTTPIFDFH